MGGDTCGLKHFQMISIEALQIFLQMGNHLRQPQNFGCKVNALYSHSLIYIYSKLSVK